MNVQSSISVLETAGETTLAGAADGQSWSREIRPRIEEAVSGIHAIDFRGVTLATASWLREAVVGTADLAKALRPDLTLIVANAPEVVLEELEVVLDAQNAVVVSATVAASLAIGGPRLLGSLDPALDETLRLVLTWPECDASALRREFPSLTLSAANNRLSALQARGILNSERRGRSRVYRSVLEDLTYGHRDGRQGDGYIRTKATQEP
jgi:hypothetical protein